MTIAYSAWFGSCRNPYGPRPTVPSAQLMSPKLGSNSCRKMIDVAMVDATTGTNTAVRYSLMNRSGRFSATAISRAPPTDSGTNSAV